MSISAQPLWERSVWESGRLWHRQGCGQETAPFPSLETCSGFGEKGPGNLSLEVASLIVSVLQI